MIKTLVLVALILGGLYFIRIPLHYSNTLSEGTVLSFSTDSLKSGDEDFKNQSPSVSIKKDGTVLIGHKVLETKLSQEDLQTLDSYIEQNNNATANPNLATVLVGYVKEGTDALSSFVSPKTASIDSKTSTSTSTNTTQAETAKQEVKTPETFVLDKNGQTKKIETDPYICSIITKSLIEEITK